MASARLQSYETLSVVMVSYQGNRDFARLNRESTVRLNQGVMLEWFALDEEILSQDYSKHGQTAPAYYHADGIEWALQRVTSRFVAIVDPDFFVVTPEWAWTMMAIMAGHGIAAIGTPWNPRWWMKRPYDLATHFLMLDTRQVDAKALNFQPDEANNGDVGCRIAGQLRPLQVELLTPVFRRMDMSLFSRPLNITSSRKTFKDFGLTSPRRYGAEEWLWKNKPFAAHYRGFPKQSPQYRGCREKFMRWAVECTA